MSNSGSSGYLCLAERFDRQCLEEEPEGGITFQVFICPMIKLKLSVSMLLRLKNSDFKYMFKYL